MCRKPTWLVILGLLQIFYRSNLVNQPPPPSHHVPETGRFNLRETGSFSKVMYNRTLVLSRLTASLIQYRTELQARLRWGEHVNLLIPRSVHRRKIILTRLFCVNNIRLLPHIVYIPSWMWSVLIKTKNGDKGYKVLVASAVIACSLIFADDVSACVSVRVVA